MQTLAYRRLQCRTNLSKVDTYPTHIYKQSPKEIHSIPILVVPRCTCVLVVCSWGLWTLNKSLSSLFRYVSHLIHGRFDSIFLYPRFSILRIHWKWSARLKTTYKAPIQPILSKAPVGMNPRSLNRTETKAHKLKPSMQHWIQSICDHVPAKKTT